MKTETSIELAAAIARLPDYQRSAITLRHIEGRLLEEICKAMQKNPASVAGLHRRCLETLRGQLGNEVSW